MKKILLALMLLSSVAYGQQTNSTNTNFTNGLGSSKFFNIPRGTVQPTTGVLAGSLFYHTTLGLQYYSGASWITLGISGAGVTSFNSRTGAITPLVGDYPFFPLYNGTGATGTWGIGITGNAATVTTNANLTGIVTSTGNATSIAGNAITDGYIASATTWNAKESALTFSAPLVRTINAISITQAATATNGFLSSTDWNIFNGKQAAYPGLQDSLTKKANRTFDNVAAAAIPISKLASSTISGVNLGGNLANLSAGTGMSFTAYNGSTARTANADTTVLQTVLNFFPKADTRYYTKTTSDGKYALQTTTISPGTGLLGGGSLAANRTISADTTALRTVANSRTLAQTQTALNLKQNVLSGTGIVKSTAGTISYLTDPLPIANGGTGSATQNFVDLTNPQNIGGVKTFNNNITLPNTTAVGVGETWPSPYLIQSGQRDVGTTETNTMRHSVLGDGTMRFEWNRSTDGNVYAAIADLSQLGLYLYNSAGTFRGRLETQSITANRAWIFPDVSGTIALVGGAGVGTVTSVAALTLGTTGTDLSSSVATGTTTPVITLQVPTASASNRGALSSTDWSTFNSKQGTITLTTTGTSGAATLVGSTLNVPNYADGGVLSLSAIGGTANANAATITGTVLNLQPADASFGGIITTGTQTIAGAKTFSVDAIVNGLTIGRGGLGGSTNTAIGFQALFNSTSSGFYNTANGYQALYSSSNGGYNTANGYQALYSNTGGAFNTANGMQALYDLTTGSNNSALGYNTGGGITTGSGNTILGANVGALSSGLTNNIILANSTGAIQAQHDGTNWTMQGTVTAPTFIGALTGNASTATTLATTRTIWGQNFNGSADVTGALTGVTGITTSGGYTQSGITANTFTGTPTFSNATYSALFTGGSVGIGTAAPNSLGNGGTNTTLEVFKTGGQGYLSLSSDLTAGASLIGVLNFGTSGASTGKSGASIQVSLNGSGSTNASADMIFYTRNGASFNQALKLAFDQTATFSGALTGTSATLISPDNAGSTNVFQVKSNNQTVGIGIGYQDIRMTSTNSSLFINGNGTGAVYLGNVSTGGVILGSALTGTSATFSKLNITEGSGGFAGQTTLVTGTKAITISGLTTASRAFVTLVSPLGASLTVQYQAVCTSNTLTIQANVSATTINVADGSILNYFIIN